MIETFVTIEQQWCCVMLMSIRNMLKSLTRELFKFRKCCRILTGNLNNKEKKVSFGTLLPSCLSKRANKMSNSSSQSLFDNFPVESPNGIEIPAKSLINKLSTAASVTQHHWFSCHERVSHTIHRALPSWTKTKKD